MAKSKQKVGKGFNRVGGFEDDSFGGASREDRPHKKTGERAGRPRREMRERIEVRDEERSLTRELSDWESYPDDDFDSTSDSDSDRL